MISGGGLPVKNDELSELETFLRASLVGVKARPEFTRGLHEHLVSSPEVEADWRDLAERRRYLWMAAAGAFSAVVLVLLGVRTLSWVLARKGN